MNNLWCRSGSSHVHEVESGRRPRNARAHAVRRRSPGPPPAARRLMSDAPGPPGTDLSPTRRSPMARPPTSPVKPRRSSSLWAVALVVAFVALAAAVVPVAGLGIGAAVAFSAASLLVFALLVPCGSSIWPPWPKPPVCAPRYGSGRRRPPAVTRTGTRTSAPRRRRRSRRRNSSWRSGCPPRSAGARSPAPGERGAAGRRTRQVVRPAPRRCVRGRRRP